MFDDCISNKVAGHVSFNWSVNWPPNSCLESERTKNKVSAITRYPLYSMSAVYRFDCIWNEFSKATSEIYQTPNVDLFMKIIDGCQPLRIFAKCSILDVWYGSEYFSLIFHILKMGLQSCWLKKWYQVIDIKKLYQITILISY